MLQMKKEASKETARKAEEQMLKLGKLYSEEMVGCFTEYKLNSLTQPLYIA